MELSRKRVLVTGGAGFIGSHIVDLLLAEDCAAITAIDNLERGSRSNLSVALQDGRVTLVEADIRDRDVMADLIQGADVVFHQAALRITHCAAEPRLAIEVMVNATFDLLELCVSNGVSKVIAASSASIYGQAEVFPTSEAHHCYQNRTLYGAAKSFNEGLLRSFNDMYGLDYVALRYFNVYGPRMDLHGRYTEVLVRWMERIAAGQPPLILGDGSQTMDFIDVRDVANANIAAAKAGITDRAFNVGTGVETSLLQLAGLLADVMGRPDLAPVFGPERAVNAVRRRLSDVAAARELLGFEAGITLEDGLSNLVEWWANSDMRASQASELVS